MPRDVSTPSPGCERAVGRGHARAGDRGPATRLRTLLALVGLVLVSGACTPVDNAMVAIFGRSMRNSIAFDPYEGPHLPDSNAVAFAASNYPPEPSDVFLGDPAQVREYDLPPMNKALMARGGGVANELTNPLEVDSTDMARGEELYNRMCMVCHGPEGYSEDAPILPKLPLMAAYNLAEGNAVGFSDGYIYGMIRVGRGNMPGYGHRLDHFDRWRIVSYVRQLQRDAGQTPGASGESQAAEPAAPEGGD